MPGRVAKRCNGSDWLSVQFRAPDMERTLQCLRLMQPGASKAVLVVVEGEAACPLWMKHWGAEPADGWAVLEQEEWETRPAFVVRLRTVVARLSSELAPEIVLVTSSRCDPSAVAARWDLATTLLACLVQTGGGELALTRGHGASARAEHALDELTGELAAEWEENGVRVSHRPLEEPPVSTVRSSVPPRLHRAAVLVENVASA